MFSIREGHERDGKASATWIRAGSAFVNRDGSMNVYLDVLPIEGRLHVREAAERRDGAGPARPTSAAEEGTPLFGSSVQAASPEVAS